MASKGISLVANGCAAHDWGQLFMFEGQICSLRRAFTIWALNLIVPW